MRDSLRIDAGLLIARMGLGLTMVFYGSQKMFGLFGGNGYVATVNGFVEQGIPPLFAHLAIAGEFFGGLGVLIGLLTPVAAFGIACTMAVATIRNMMAPGALDAVFASGNPADASRLFYSGSLFFMAMTIMIAGPGAFSVDQRAKQGKKRR